MEDEREEKKNLGSFLEFSFGQAMFVVHRRPPSGDTEQAVGCRSLELRRNVWVEREDWDSLNHTTYK